MGFDGIDIGPVHVGPPSTWLPRGDAAGDDGRPFGRPWDSYLPKLPQVIEGGIEGAARRLVDLVHREERPTPDGRLIQLPLDRSFEASRALVDEHGMYGAPDKFHTNDSWGVWRTEIWPLSQVLHGRVLQAMQGGDWARVEGIFRDIEAYRHGDGFEGGISPKLERFYDDNEWIGLAGMQAYDATGDHRYLEHAKRTFEFVRTGRHQDGGMYWVEQDRVARHTCSTAPGGQLAVQLYQATGDRQYLDFAIEQADWLAEHLRSPEGLYYDNVSDSGIYNRDIYSYNQGAPLGLDVQLYRSTGDTRFLDRAVSTAHAAMRHFAANDGLWKQPPVFNAVFMRNLLALEAVTKDPVYHLYVDAYLDRAWRESRNPENGLFNQGGIGSYAPKPGAVIDQGAFAQLYAARALPPDKWVDLT